MSRQHALDLSQAGGGAGGRQTAEPRELSLDENVSFQCGHRRCIQGCFSPAFAGVRMADLQFASSRRHERIHATSPATVYVGRRGIAATVKNISSGGVFLSTDAPFYVGNQIDIVLMLPKELGGLPFSQLVCCHGNIVRVEQSSGEYGIAAEVESIADLPPGSTGSAA